MSVTIEHDSDGSWMLLGDKRVRVEPGWVLHFQSSLVFVPAVEVESHTFSLAHRSLTLTLKPQADIDGFARRDEPFTMTFDLDRVRVERIIETSDGKSLKWCTL